MSPAAQASSLSCWTPEAAGKVARRGDERREIKRGRAERQRDMRPEGKLLQSMMDMGSISTSVYHLRNPEIPLHPKVSLVIADAESCCIACRQVRRQMGLPDIVIPINLDCLVLYHSCPSLLVSQSETAYPMVIAPSSASFLGNVRAFLWTSQLASQHASPPQTTQACCRDREDALGAPPAYRGAWLAQSRTVSGQPVATLSPTQASIEHEQLVGQLQVRPRLQSCQKLADAL
jgi:hypothetical protein